MKKPITATTVQNHCHPHIINELDAHTGLFMILSTLIMPDGRRLHSYLGSAFTMYPAMNDDTIAPLKLNASDAQTKLAIIRKYYPEARIVECEKVMTPSGKLLVQ